MGCCHSAPSADSEQAQPARPPAAQHGAGLLAADSSQTAINRPVQHSHSRPSRLGTFRRDVSLAATAGGSNGRPNASIRPPTPLLSSPDHLPQHPPPWSRSVLESERSAFFETRLTGRAETWSAIRLACESLRRGDVVEAQGILDAAAVSCPNGKVSKGRSASGDRVKGGLFDERGTAYEVPAWVVTDPEDVADDEDHESDAEEGEKQEAGELVVEHKQDKGKGRALDPGETVLVRVRLSNGRPDLSIELGMKQPLSVLIEQVIEYTAASKVRLSYLGGLLQERRSLESYGYEAGHVLNAYLLE